MKNYKAITIITHNRKYIEVPYRRLSDIKDYLEKSYRIKIADKVFIGSHVEIEEGVIINSNVRIGNNVTICTSSCIKEGAVVKSNVTIEGATIGKGAEIGEYATVEPGTLIFGNSKIKAYTKVYCQYRFPIRGTDSAVFAYVDERYRYGIAKHIIVQVGDILEVHKDKTIDEIKRELNLRGMLI